MLNVDRNVFSPPPGGPSSAASGTRTRSKITSAVRISRRPTGSVTAVSMPGSVMSTRKLVSPSSAFA